VGQKSLGITSSERAKQTWSKPEFRQKMSLIASERQKRMWKDPEYRVKQTERLRPVSKPYLLNKIKVGRKRIDSVIDRKGKGKANSYTNKSTPNWPR